MCWADISALWYSINVQVISALLKFESTQCHELWHIEDAHKSAIKKAFFSPDDTIIVTCSEDQHKVTHYYCTYYYSPSQHL